MVRMTQPWTKRTGYRMADRSTGYSGEKFKPVCYQRLLRESQDDGRRVGLDGEIREIPFKEAQEFILQFEWLGTMGATQFSFGFYVDGTLTAVLCFGVTAGSGVLAEPFGDMHKTKGIILVRGACAPWAHEHTASFVIGRVMPLMAAKGYEFVIAYSDPEAGEIGTVYQATNWNFYGLTSPITYLVRPDGKRVDPRLVYKYARKFGRSSKEQKAIFEAEGYTYEKGNRKLKYIKLIGDRRSRKRLLADQRVKFYPYLKRKEDMRDIYSDFAAIQ